MRALVEEKIKDSKLGLAMRHMPSGYEAVKMMWMWAALLGLNISSWLQGLIGHDEPGGRAHGASAFDENWPAFPLASRDTPGVSRSTLPPSTITVAWPTRGGPSTISSPNRARRSSAQFPTAPRGHDPGDRSSSDKSSEPWSDAPPVLRNASRIAAGNSNFIVTSPAASDPPLLADLDQIGLELTQVDLVGAGGTFVGRNPPVRLPHHLLGDVERLGLRRWHVHLATSEVALVERTNRS